MTKETYDSRYVICPHCEHKHGDAWEITGNDETVRERECDKCNKPFKCWADVSIWYAAEAVHEEPVS